MSLHDEIGVSCASRTWQKNLGNTQLNTIIGDDKLIEDAAGTGLMLIPPHMWICRNIIARRSAHL